MHPDSHLPGFALRAIFSALALDGLAGLNGLIDGPAQI